MERLLRTCVCRAQQGCEAGACIPGEVLVPSPAGSSQGWKQQGPLAEERARSRERARLLESRVVVRHEGFVSSPRKGLPEVLDPSKKLQQLPLSALQLVLEAVSACSRCQSTDEDFFFFK